MKRIERLPEGLDLDALARHWIEVGLATGPVDRVAMGAAAKDLYTSTGLEEPLIVWLDSPWRTSIAGVMLVQVGDQVWDQVWDQVRGQVWGQVGDQVWGQVWGQVRGQVGDQVRDQVWGHMFGQHDTYWVAWIDALVKAGARIDRGEHRLWFDALTRLTGTHWFLPLHGVCLMSERPVELHLDPQGRLHSTHGMALRYPDDFGIWAVHGVRVREEIVTRPASITAESVLKEPNAEVRRVMCEQMGWDRFVTEARLELVDECPDPANFPHTLRLYDTPEQVLGVPVRVLLVTNATPERDGTVRDFGLTVPAEVSSALAAGAWTFDMTEKQYAKLARAT